jgi:chromosome segregation ATPase
MTRARAVVCGFCLLGALLFVESAAAQSASAPSLAEIARKEAERRAKIKSSAKTYTNEDLRKGPPLTTGIPASKPPTSEPAGATQKQPAPPDPAKEEKHWRDRITAARATLERNQVFLDALQSRINALTADFTARDDPAQRALIGIERQRALVEMDRVKAEIQQITQQIADIEEEARRAGVPPGWLR